MANILEPAQYKLIYKMSFLAVGSHIYAIYNRHYVMSLCPAILFLTSINYWRKPELCWRRNVDITCVLLSLIYHLYKAYKSQYMIQYYTITLFASSMYPLAIYYSKQKLYWHSTYAHCVLHIMANLASIILYSGKL